VTLTKSIQQLAAGNLSGDLPPSLSRRRDEIGAVARAAVVFRDAMQRDASAEAERQRLQAVTEQEKLTALREAADSIERETTAVAVKSAERSEALGRQAVGLAESAARMLASVESAQTASGDALGTCEVVAAAGEELAVSAREIANQIAVSTAEIVNAARAGEQAHQIIERLSASMGEIGTIARLIGDIAGRTNLLALNATIEAARAGEAGRGFAVVANEVKTLATQTARSTDEIARSVGAIQVATRDAVTVVAEMVRRVGSIEHITNAIAAAAEQQTAATGEIARNVIGTVESMRVVTGQIASVRDEAGGTGAAAEEMRTAARSVADQIAELRGAMVRIVRTSSDAADRRGDDRIALNQPVVLVVAGEPVQAHCLNIGRGGARVLADRHLVAGTAAILRVNGLPDLPGSLLHSGNEVSIRFGAPAANAPPELAAWLTRKIAA
jgi:methyl-accepting chemotaxis protein